MQLKTNLSSALRQNSGLDRRRGYLGMSGIGNCSRKLYFEFVNGRDEPDDLNHWYCWTGYMHEGEVLSLLGRHIEQQLLEIVAGYDTRFRGHIDGVLEGNLIEIKSVNWNKFVSVKRHDQAVPNHLYQVQMYLRHGGFPKAFIIYIARDVVHKEANGLPLYVVEVLPDESLADRLDEKAQAILRAIDVGEPPVCDCGYCND